MNRTTQLGNIAVSYDETGKGRPLVFLHGYLEAKEVWKPLTEILSREYRIITIDLPGHGSSGITGEVHTMEFIAEAVREVMRDAGTDRVIIIGHSLGGYAALAFAAMYPENLAGYVLFHSHPHADIPEAIGKEEPGDISRQGREERPDVSRQCFHDVCREEPRDHG